MSKLKNAEIFKISKTAFTKEARFAKGPLENNSRAIASLATIIKQE